MIKRDKIILTVLSVVCVATFILMVVSINEGNNRQITFEPPMFEQNAVKGSPEISDESWMQIYREGMSFSAHICGRISIYDRNKTDIYLSNDKGNNVWIKVRIMDESGSVLGETGLLKPDEYVKTICFDCPPTVGQNVKVKIMSYQQYTYYSLGTVILNTIVE